MKILVVFGTRPEAIKLAPLIKLVRSDSYFDVRICVTGQHKEMLQQVLSLFDLQPDTNLGIMEKSRNLSEITSNAILGLNTEIQTYKPDYVLVHGDTTTTFSASLAAFYANVPVGHIEAGLRTGNIQSPWPEEFNRRVTSLVASRHYCPTEQSQHNLVSEGVPKDSTKVTGNTVIDALLLTSKKIRSNRTLSESLREKFNYLDSKKRTILVTGHRRESFGSGFENLCHAIKTLSKRTDIQIVYPVHLNPNVQKPVSRILQNTKNVHLTNPMGYVEFIYLMMNSYLILTDSGGIQEEAPSLGKPVLVTRETTERPEGIDAGTVKLVGTNENAICTAVTSLLDDNAHYTKMSTAHNPYGDGTASEIIIEDLKSV